MWIQASSFISLWAESKLDIDENREKKEKTARKCFESPRQKHFISLWKRNAAEIKVRKETTWRSLQKNSSKQVVYSSTCSLTFNLFWLWLSWFFILWHFCKSRWRREEFVLWKWTRNDTLTCHRKSTEENQNRERGERKSSSCDPEIIPLLKSRFIIRLSAPKSVFPECYLSVSVDESDKPRERGSVFVT